ncbi:hypothetical protein [Nocardia goodfellowii]|uniref:Secreted protein n=1 Tax=Nocardia goodfellowii TaxID=882446 RepID=A0ABS4Q695_9NOCA|nr:hypothetical protein [Nocardia goodfellowii]MBP2187218.1 hypothetical protein [Nocardia goodfellowii]
MRRTVSALAAGALATGALALAAPAAHAGAPGQACSRPGATERVFVKVGNVDRKAIIACVNNGNGHVWKVVNWVQPGTSDG